MLDRVLLLWFVASLAVAVVIDAEIVTGSHDVRRVAWHFSVAVAARPARCVVLGK